MNQLAKMDLPKGTIPAVSSIGAGAATYWFAQQRMDPNDALLLAGLAAFGGFFVSRMVIDYRQMA